MRLIDMIDLDAEPCDGAEGCPARSEHMTADLSLLCDMHYEALKAANEQAKLEEWRRWATARQVKGAGG